MFRICRMDLSHSSKICTFIWAACAAGSSIGCMDDTLHIVPAGSVDDGNAEATVSEGADNLVTAGVQTAEAGVDGVTSALDALNSTGPDGASGQANGASGQGPGPGKQGQGTATPDCWQLPLVDRARLLPASGRAADLVGGKIVGSLTSPTNGFVDLATISAPPAEGEWLEVALENTTAYRYVKYYGPGGSYGAIADVELYAGEQRVLGDGFGSAGSRDDAGSVFANALDGDASTWFEGPLPNDNYVGLDLGADHELAPPTFSPAAGTAASGDPVTITAPEGASVWYTTDGSDPAVSGLPYTGAIPLPGGSTLIKAIAAGDCALPSPIAQSIYSTGAAPDDPMSRPSASGVQSSMHIGNSLTDTINDLLPTLAAEGGIALDYNRYTIPGAGTWLYDQQPTGGFGVEDVQETLRTRPFDHLSMQPFPNLPCQPVPSSDGNDSDSGYLDQAWSDAMTQNPNVQLWVYQQWPAPTDYVDCFTGGGWTRGDWQPDAPTSWEDGVATQLTYQEAVRSALVTLHPSAPPPYIVPGGLALVMLKHAIEQGEVPGITDFFGTLFQAGGEDIHMTGAGVYLITLVFYSSMFQQSPEGLANESGGELTAEQAAIFQRIAWDTVAGYPLSGVAR
jgi:hypothetical protein